MVLTVITTTADILGNPQEPGNISKNDSQLLFGEEFEVEEEHGTYVYGHSVLDGYKGYVERDQLVTNAPKANAIVKNKLSHIYPQPDFKSRPIEKLGFLSRLTILEDEENGFIKREDGNWIFKDHIAALDSFKMPEDLAQTATMYLGTPYLYGGRSIFGIDCSGLIQQIIMAHGNNCPPRDSKDQEEHFTKQKRSDKLERNDIVFFKGHVGIMMDDSVILNATSRHMSTVLEDVRDLEKIYGGITRVAEI